MGGRCVICGTTERLSITGINGTLVNEQKTPFNNSQMKMFKFYIDNPNKAKERLQVLCVTDARKRLTGRDYIFSVEGLIRHTEARAKQIIPFEDSSIEKAIQNELKLRNIKFELHKEFKIPPWRPHRVDIFIEPNICIEADGDYYHSLPRVKDRDKIVNTEIPKQGINLLRFPEKQIKNDLKGVMAKILKNLVFPYFLCKYTSLRY